MAICRKFNAFLVITAQGVLLMVKLLQSFKFELPFLFSVFTCDLYFFTCELLGLELFCTFFLNLDHLLQ